MVGSTIRSSVGASSSTGENIFQIVIPAQAGIQLLFASASTTQPSEHLEGQELDSGFRRNDELIFQRFHGLGCRSHSSSS
jgi:hypothetical protein